MGNALGLVWSKIVLGSSFLIVEVDDNAMDGLGSSPCSRASEVKILLSG